MLDRIDTLAQQREAFRADVLDGLSRPQKTLPSRWLYDDRGSQLFEEITALPEYYPTRTETGILNDRSADIAAIFGPQAVLVEYGAGAGIKTEIVLAALDDPRLYVPIDISGDFLKASAERIRARFPGLPVAPVVADFTDEFDLPADLPRDGRRGGFFPGSTLGNLGRKEALTFLARMRRHVGGDGVAVLGVDLKKDIDTLLTAYDDSAGVTAAFNRNILVRMERELGAEVALDDFAHEARWNAEASAVEMHLVAQAAGTISVAGRSFAFAAGETIHTESSRKYDVDSLTDMAGEAGWSLDHVWTDAEGLFALVSLSAA
ncbi:L-histidine N(alpha)-methyltransferase [Aurantimonas sp. A2-1-M11]|uniref:L-histidine N(alpha)-methyltransferase n=1 Tax=Aurantimonas sp. A2-1-M11 TaxID=3113712 RepID=UPI002F9529D3